MRVFCSGKSAFVSTTWKATPFLSRKRSSAKSERLRPKRASAKRKTRRRFLQTAGGGVLESSSWRLAKKKKEAAKGEKRPSAYERVLR